MDKSKKQNKKLTFERLLILFLIFAVLGLLIYINPDNGLNKNNKEIDNSICSKIRGTPAWVEESGEIIKYGVITINQSNQEFSDKLTENLIVNKVTFVYNSDCGYCQLQISIFGEKNFNKLKEKGLALDCNE